MVSIKNLSNKIDQTKKFQIITLILVVVFLLKGWIYAIFVVPPAMGVAPDDMGHMSYVKFMINEKSLPILFESTIDKVVYESFLETEKGIWKKFALKQYFEPTETLNWIAQHPPLYYLLIAPIYKMASFFTSDLSLILIAIRLFTLLLGAITIIYLCKLSDLMNLKLWIKCCILCSFVFNLAIQWCFFNITNDSLLILLSTATLYYLISYTSTYNNKYFYMFIVFASLIVTTKYTGIILLVPYIVFFSYKEVSSNGFETFLQKTFSGIIIGIILTAPLLTWNYNLYGRFFPVAHSAIQNSKADITMFHFLTHLPYFDDLYWNICGLLGWTSFARANIYIKIFMALFILISGVRGLKNVQKKSKIIIVIFSTTFFIIQYIVCKFFFSTSLASTSMLLLFLSALLSIRKKRDKEIVALFVCTIIFYFVIMLSQQYNLYLLFGQMRGIQGRYYYILFFPVSYLVFEQFNKIATKQMQAGSIAYIIAQIILEILFAKELFERTLLIS